MIGFLTYLPTTAYFHQFFFLLAFFFVLIRDRNYLLAQFNEFLKSPKHAISWNLLIILFIILLSSTNRLIHWQVAVSNYKDLFPYFLLLIPSYVIAIRFKKADAKWLVIMVAIESVVVAIEWFAGVNTFDQRLEGYRSFSGAGLAYEMRPFGLSANSSHIASKALMGWLLLDFFDFSRRFKISMKFLLAVTIVMTFNRSVIVALGVYLIIQQIMFVFQGKYKLENMLLWFGSMIAVVIGGIAVVFLKGEAIINQFTRNQGTIELTGREYIWADFLKFISENLAFGNYSVKLWLDGYHAHNSYIELIATNGVFISLLYFALILRNIRQSNWNYVVAILIFGITQYAFFWGISLVDIVFWVILFTWSNVQSQKEVIPPLPNEPLRVANSK